MSRVVSVDDNGQIIYHGMLTSTDIASINSIIEKLQKEIPQIEADLTEQFGNGAQYKYNLGKFLGTLLNRYHIIGSERRRFWDEIKKLASQEERKRYEGTKAVTRSFYEQCWQMSQLAEKYGADLIDKLSWKQWQDILDRKANRADERIFLWFQKHDKLGSKEFPEFEKALNIYLKKKDTSIFENEELFAIYDYILLMAQTWVALFAQFKKDYPKSQKIKSKLKWSRKFYETCFKMRREEGVAVVTDNICQQAFNTLMIGKKM